MQDAAEQTIGHRARPGSDAAETTSTAINADSHRNTRSDSARATGAPEKLATGPRDLASLSCGCRNHRQLRRWIDRYLRENPVPIKAQRNAGTLRSLLAEITRWRAPVRLRLASLEVLRPIVAAHCDALTPVHESNGSVAQTQEQRRDLLTAAILCQHLALAYTSVCLQLVEQPQTLFFRRRMARALHRSIDGYRRLVQLSSHHFLATPKSCWSRMQRLVQLAREHHLDQRRVLDPLARSRAGAGPLARFEKVLQPYLQSALFASANPLQASFDEQQQLWRCCAQWASGVTLQEQLNPAAKNLLCSLRLDQAPIPGARLQHSRLDMKHFAAPLGWSIDLSAPLQKLKQRLRRPGKLSPDLLNRVQDLWAGEKARGGQRTPVHIRGEVILGISAICHHLKQDDELSVADNPSSLYSRALPSAPSTASYAARRSDSAGAQKRYQPIPATLLNTSDSGAGLRLPPDTQGRLHSGDLIALRAKDRWEVALVRWQYGLPDQCRAGVEFLTGHTSAVRVHRYTRDGRRTDPMAGLLTGDAGLPPELVLPIPLFQSGDTVDIVAAGQIRTVTLHQRNLSTGSIAIFEFS